jgi:hypothetical protein
MAVQFHVEPAFATLWQSLALEPGGLWGDPRLVIWRRLPERSNAWLDAPDPAGRQVRLHLKLHAPTRWGRTPAEREVRGITLLTEAGIPTVSLVAWGVLEDRRSFTATLDLAGYEAADKLLERRVLSFGDLLAPTAELAARLHVAGLHHQDLYLCHFFTRPESLELRLIDAARVRPIPALPWRQRWVVKDLAQFWYSARQLDIPPAELEQWLAVYLACRGLMAQAAGLLRRIERKVARIARHDQRLRQRQPGRNISLPGEGGP